jgi:hypothetical protein
METYEQLKLFMTGDELRAEYSTPDKVVLEGEAVVMYAAADQLVPVLYKD